MDDFERLRGRSGSSISATSRATNAQCRSGWGVILALMVALPLTALAGTRKLT